MARDAAISTQRPGIRYMPFVTMVMNWKLASTLDAEPQTVCEDKIPWLISRYT